MYKTKVGKERGYDRLKTMHNKLLEWNCNKFTKTVIHFYAEPIDADKDSKQTEWFNLYLIKKNYSYHIQYLGKLITLTQTATMEHLLVTAS